MGLGKGSAGIGGYDRLGGSLVIAYATLCCSCTVYFSYLIFVFAFTQHFVFTLLPPLILLLVLCQNIMDKGRVYSL